MKRLLFLFSALLLPVICFAHDYTGNGGFLSGIAHPILGYDHFLAMLCVGIISAQIGKSAIWTVPLTFMFVMLLGGVIGMRHFGEIPVEIGIALSVVLLGAAIGIDKKMPVIMAMIFVGLFAIFHGYAHGKEMPEVAIPYVYALGFMVGTAGIHLAGVLIGHVLTRSNKLKRILKIIGWSIALAGVFIFVLAVK
ncbi:MAG: HupE/UreJ family protein [Bacteroidales bacterium]|nr:HupE/UreJ family protein [Bacteroidales bacterium]